MVDIFIVAILISEIISTISIFMLLNYTIVRYRTNERGGIHTGFASAGIVMIIAGMCLYCSLKTIETTILLFSDFYYKRMISSGAMMILKNMSYLFSTCWINAICFNLTKGAVSMKEPKKNNSWKSYGFSHTQFFKWMIFPITILMGYVTASIVFLCIMYKNDDKESNDSIVFSKRKPLIHLETTFYIISGISILVSTTALIIFGSFMKKTYERKNSKRSVWKKLPPPLKRSIKCCFIMAFLWTIPFTAWIMKTTTTQENEIVSKVCNILQLIYSFQGLILYCVVYFDRSINDPLSRTGSRSTKQNIEHDEPLVATKKNENDKNIQQIS